MFKNKNPDGTLNLCGKNIKKYRKELNLSQRQLADKLQILGLEINKNAIQQIELGKRYVIDIELKIFASFFNVTIDKLVS